MPWSKLKNRHARPTRLWRLAWATGLTASWQPAPPGAWERSFRGSSPPRSGSTAASDGTSTYTFGGYGETVDQPREVVNDLLQYSPEAGDWEQLQEPAGRTAADRPGPRLAGSSSSRSWWAPSRRAIDLHACKQTQMSYPRARRGMDGGRTSECAFSSVPAGTGVGRSVKGRSSTWSQGRRRPSRNGPNVAARLRCETCGGRRNAGRPTTAWAFQNASLRRAVGVL